MAKRNQPGPVYQWGAVRRWLAETVQEPRRPGTQTWAASALPTRRARRTVLRERQRSDHPGSQSPCLSGGAGQQRLYGQDPVSGQQWWKTAWKAGGLLDWAPYLRTQLAGPGAFGHARNLRSCRLCTTQAWREGHLYKSPFAHIKPTYNNLQQNGLQMASCSRKTFKSTKNTIRANKQVWQGDIVQDQHSIIFISIH